MNLRLKDFLKINKLMEMANESDTTIIIGKKGKKVYMMSDSAYQKLQKNSTNSIRDKEIRHQAGKSTKKHN